MSVQQISRRQFLQISAFGSGGLLLAACGANAPAPTSTPNTSSVFSGGSASTGSEEDEVRVMVRDVQDFALESDEWEGQYGWVTFTLYEGRHNGEPIYFIRTDASNQEYATREGLVYVPLLNQGKEIAQSLYQFEDGSPPVLSTSPDDENFIPLFHIKNVSGGSFDSAEAVEEAVANGEAEIEETAVFVNHPVVKWANGELPHDTELKETLGLGPLIEPVNIEDMTATFKLHQCYPGSRYIVTDTSMAPMAPMMGILASPTSQALLDNGGTDEIWVFGNGIPGSGAMGFQPAIFDNKAGEPAWSPYWSHLTVIWADESKASVLKTSAEVRELVASGDLEQFNGVPDSHPNGFVVNCPAPILAPNDFSA